MRNLLCILLLFITVNCLAQNDIVDSVLATQKSDQPELSKGSDKRQDLLEAIIATEVPDSDTNSVASLYPNPIKDKAIIELDKEYKEIIVVISDVKGNIVHFDNFYDVALIQFNVDLPKGVYTMNAFDENETKLLGKLFIKK